MSGGSMNYLYSWVESAYEEFELNSPERKAFAKHLKLVAKALRAIEWNDSGDGDDSESEAIRNCLHSSAVLEATIQDAKNAYTMLKNELESFGVKD